MKLLAFDYSNLLLRHASNPYSSYQDPQGRSVSGPVGSIAQIIRLVRQEKPTHMLVARDGARADSFRRQIDSAYKAHRPDASDEIRYQFELAYRVLEAFQWPVVQMGDYEADDVLASAARGFTGRSVVVTGDKDLLACASDTVRIHLLRPGGAQECGPSEVLDIMGVSPERVCDYKALVGDPSDGIVGVEGIGPKRALLLLENYHSLEDLLLAVEKGPLNIKGISPKMEDSLRQNSEIARISYRLASLVQNLEIDYNTLRLPDMPSAESHGPFLEEVGLRDLRQQLEEKKVRTGPIDIDSTWKSLFSD